MMRIHNFAAVLPLSGLSKPEQLSAGDSWQLWTATEEGAFVSQKIYVLCLESRATWTMADGVSASIRATLPKGGHYHAIVQNSASIAADLPRVQRDYRAQSVTTVRALLARAYARMLGTTRVERDTEQERLFVDPDVEREASPGASQKATETLRAWLTDDAPTPSRVAALIAPAGIGKTTVVSHLYRVLRSEFASGAMEIARIPLIVQSDHWAKLSERTTLSLWDIWRETLDVLYTSTMNRDDFDTCVGAGLFVPIFDGFDELCTRLRAHFSPTQTLESLIDLVRDSDGRILLTTRDAFWNDNIPGTQRLGVAQFTLLPFNKPQTKKYFENRFRIPPDTPKREIADRILGRLGSIAYKDRQPGFRDRITAVPLIVALVAECADSTRADDSIARYGALLDGLDPVEGILLMLFERERERRKLAITAENQLQLFTELAGDYPDGFSVDTLKLYAATYGGIAEDDAQFAALQDHAILSSSGDGRSPRFEFLADYLAARRLVDSLFAPEIDLRAIPILEQQARGGSSLIERAVDRLFAKFPGRWDMEVTRVWRRLPRAMSRRARSGLWHLIAESVARDVRGPRSDRTAALQRIVNLKAAAPFSELYVEGSVAGLDFSGVTWDSCVFSNAGFAKCIFSAESRFVKCQFTGAFEVEECDGFGRATFEQCEFGSGARDVVQSQQDDAHRLSVTSEQVTFTVRLALEKFQRGLGFKTLAAANARTGRLGKSPLCDLVWEALQRFGVVEPIRISGVAEGGLKIADGREAEVYNFLSNAMLIGGLRDAVMLLEEQAHVPSKSRSANKLGHT